MPVSTSSRHATKSPATAGLLVVYTGGGKGKTTAALGVAMRALGRGMTVLVIQYIKGDWVTGEENFFRMISSVDGMPRSVFVKGGLGFVGIMGDKKPRSAHRLKAKESIARTCELLLKKEFQVVILDELLTAYEEGLVTQRDIQAVLRARGKDVDMIITGHKKVPDFLAQKADIITDMKKLKHPFDRGILAKVGIDF